MAAGSIKLTPFDEGLVQPASVDIQLGNEVAMYRTWNALGQYGKHDLPPLFPGSGVDVDNEMVHDYIEDGNCLVLDPGDFVLASTLQHVTLDASMSARVEGKSTLGRLGLIIHSTAGFVDPGFSGQLTLEMTNLNQRALILEPGMRIAQLSFMPLSAPAKKPYGHEDLCSKYQNQAGVTPPKAMAMPYLPNA